MHETPLIQVYITTAKNPREYFSLYKSNEKYRPAGRTEARNTRLQDVQIGTKYPPSKRTDRETEYPPTGRTERQSIRLQDRPRDGISA